MKQCRLCKKDTDYFFKEKLKIRKNETSFYNYVYFICNSCNTKRKRVYAKTEIGRLNINKASAKSIKKYPKKQKAREKVNYALKVGKILKDKVCSSCKEEKKLDAHHEDYSKPLEIVWLCKKCHYLKHNK